jgi:hypothetical protein
MELVSPPGGGDVNTCNSRLASIRFPTIEQLDKPRADEFSLVVECGFSGL